MVLLALFVILLLLIMKGVVPRVNFALWKTNAVLAVVYLAVLAMSVLSLPLLPAKNLAQPVTDSPKAYSSDPRVLFQLAAQRSSGQGKGIYTNGIYQNSKQEFTPEGTTLHLKIADNDYNNILIQRNNADDGKIAVSSFVATTEVDGVDFTQRLAPPRISLQNGTLVVQAGPQQNFTFKVVQAPFALQQFQVRNVDGSGSSPSHQWETMGWKALYLVIPENVKVDQGDYHVITQ